MSVVDNTQDILDLALEGLAAIAKLTKNVVDDNAVAVLFAVRAIVEAFDGHREGNVSYADVKEAYANLLKSLEANDSAADAKLKDRFPTT